MIPQRWIEAYLNLLLRFRITGGALAEGATGLAFSVLR